MVWYSISLLHIAPYSPKGGIGLVTINFIFAPTTNYLKQIISAFSILNFVYTEPYEISFGVFNI